MAKNPFRPAVMGLLALGSLGPNTVDLFGGPVMSSASAEPLSETAKERLDDAERKRRRKAEKRLRDASRR
jgi:hypothetical protein